MKKSLTTVTQESETWDLIIRPKSGWFEFNFKDLWLYRDLIFLFVKRDLVVTYKQTILGPLWLLLQPLLSSSVFTIVFSNIAKMPTDGVPPFLFYLTGMVAWGYFSLCVTNSSNTFVTNAAIFGKVYFPRLTVPISIVISSGFKFLIQFCFFLALYAFFAWRDSSIRPNLWVCGVPLLILQMAILGLGIGIFVSSLVTKYRDLALLITFGVQLWMYATPILYPASQIPERYRAIYMLNPMASIIEWFKLAFFGTGLLQLDHVIYSWIATIGIFLFGLVLFNRAEKSFMDIV